MTLVGTFFRLLISVKANAEFIEKVLAWHPKDDSRIGGIRGMGTPPKNVIFFSLYLFTNIE